MRKESSANENASDNEQPIKEEKSPLNFQKDYSQVLQEKSVDVPSSIPDKREKIVVQKIEGSASLSLVSQRAEVNDDDSDSNGPSQS